tara:strand:- start:779 stop:892 length:114 start_codon:yes stop_codon:yes gene_type:complete
MSEIKGIGKASAGMIQEMLDTGKIAKLENFREELGPL